MSGWLNPDAAAGRFLAFYMVLALPLLRLLVRARYQLWQPEVPAVLAMLAIPCFLLAMLSRQTRVFLTLLALWAALFATSSLHAQTFPSWNWGLAFGIVAILTGAAAAVFRQRLPELMALLLVGMLAAEVALLATGRDGVPVVASEPASAPGAHPPHKIYLVLDEQTGLAGFPREIPPCAEAAERWSGLLARRGFTVYPNAFSNYDQTWQSIPSIVNDQLLRPRGRYRLENNLVAGNALFAGATARGLDLAVYQSDYVRFNLPRYRYSVVREYDANDVSARLGTSASWLDRTKDILVWFFLLDRPTMHLLRRFAPDLSTAVRIGPLSVRRLWPRTVWRDILRAPRSTLFFIHLLHPHHPYVYDANGNVRPYAEWHRPEAHSRSEYVRNYREYCGQSSFLARQVDEFFGALQEAGILASSQIVLQGDHGSRIAIVADGATPAVDGRAFPPQPTQRELLDSFSAMFAIRQPGPSQSQTDATKGSILFLIRRKDGRLQPGEERELNQVYESGALDKVTRAIPMLDIWKD